MCTLKKAIICLAVAVCGLTVLLADGEPAETEGREGQLWTYNATTMTLTEIVETGVKAWSFTLTAEGKITAKTSGANTTVDLRRATMPSEAPEIIEIDDTVGMKVRTDSVCETLYLPETVCALRGHTFLNWSKLKHVEFPLNPPSFTMGATTTGGTFAGTLVTNAVLPLTMTTLSTASLYNMSKLVYVQFPPALVKLEKDALSLSTAVREIRCLGWGEYLTASGGSPYANWKAMQARFLVQVDNADVLAFVSDSTKVTPWSKVSDANRDAYFAKYGAKAMTPIGLTVAVSGGLPATWVVADCEDARLTVDAISTQALNATPKPTVRDDNGQVVDPSNLEFSYCRNDQPGLASVIVTGLAGSPVEGLKGATLFTVSSRPTADTFTWKSCANGNFEDVANWMTASGNPGRPELADDIVILPKFESDVSYAVTVNSPFVISALTVGDVNGVAGTCVASLIFKTGDQVNRVNENVLVKANGAITHYGPADTQKDSLILQIGGNCTVEASGAIHADGMGHTVNKGPGYAQMTRAASHAGQGKNANGGPYGSVLRPVKWGSATSGARGGGAIHLDVGGTLTVNGRVSANGGPLNAHYTSCGGSLWIECASIDGAGLVEARDGQTNERTADYTSSGGRLAIYQRIATDFTAFPVTQMATVQYGYNAAGTIYLECADGRRDLYVVGGGMNAPQKTPFPMPDDGNDLLQYTNLNVHVSGYSHLSVCDVMFPASVLPIRSLEVSGKAMMTIGGGSVLQVSGDIDTTGAKSVVGGVIELVGTGTTKILGASTITSVEGVVCTNAGKRIAFGTAAADKLAIGADMDFVMKGSEDSPVSLGSTENGVQWFLSMNSNPGVVVVEHVTVQDSDASSGAPILAIYSQDGGNNKNWGFSNPIVPGETITWTGTLDTKWSAAENWDRGRAPVGTDRIAIPEGKANNPVLLDGEFLFNAIDVEDGAVLTLGGGCSVTVTNAFTVAGTLTFAGTENLLLSGDADFTGGTVNKGTGRVHIVGAADQLIDFGDTTLFRVDCEKSSGNVSFGAHGFTADVFTCAASTPITFTFAAGATYAVPALSLNSIGGSRQITLVSSVPGTAWKLVTSEQAQSVSGVEAHDSDASAGATVFAGVKSVAADNCKNWDTTTQVALWLGGDGNWTDPAKWSSGEVPSATTVVSISAAGDETLTVTVPVGTSAAMKSLTLKTDEGGKVSMVAKSGITVETDVDVQSGAVLVLDAFADEGASPNLVKGNVLVRDGGTITHSGPGDEQNARVDLAVRGNVTIDAGGKIDVNGKGYNATKGPEGNTYGNVHGSGHAGYGYGNPKKPYGSILHPITWGSATQRSSAGGAIRLDIQGDLVLNGEISADGAYNSGSYSHGGGSVWIDCASLTGDGHIYAREGYRTDWFIDGQTTSSGGRIAVYQHVATNFDAFPKSRIITNRQDYSAAGTVYLESADTTGGTDLYVVGSAKNTTLQTSFPMPDDGDPLQYTNVNVHVGASAVLYVCDQAPGSKVAVRSLEVTNSGRVMFAANSGLLICETLDATGAAAFNCGTTGYIEFGGDGEGELLGAKKITNIGGFVCTNAGKTVRFDTSANGVLTMPAGANLMLRGEGESPVSLLPVDGSATWKIDVDANAIVDVKCVAVSNSTCVSSSISAVNSHDLGGNVKWSFIEEILPGEEIVWTGAESTDWTNPQNWDRGRVPVLTDVILVNALGGNEANYPTLGSGVYAFEQVTVGSGASFTLDGCDLTISNKLIVAGALTFAGAERLRLVGEADFAGGQVVKGGSTVSLEGEGAQTVDFGGCTFHFLCIAKNRGTVAVKGGFAADILRCCPSGELTLEFFEGVTVRANDLCLSGEGEQLTLAGGAWSLWATADRQVVANVKVSGCTATGATIYAGESSTDAGNNSGWDFVTETGVWVGGDGIWTDTAHWVDGRVPTAAARVKLAAGENARMTITIPENNAVEVKTLTLSGVAGGRATVVANSPLRAETIDLSENGTLELNCYDDAGEAPNVVTGDVLVRNGGRISHSGPANAANAKLHLKVCGNVTVEEGGSIDADSKGHAANKGPGASVGNCVSAGYAGYGHSTINNDSSREVSDHTFTYRPYGSIFRPTDWGSSGDRVPAGGAVHLVVGGTLTVNGVVSADSSTYETSYASSGGSVWIECGAIVGSGRVSAREGNSDRADKSRADQRWCDCTSSGGRIAIYQTLARDFDAFPMSRISTVRKGFNAVGTVYLESAYTGSGTWLYLQTDESIKHKTKFPMESDGDPEKAFRNVNVVVKGESLLNVESDVTIRDLICETSDSDRAKAPHVYLNGKTVKIRSMRHRDGRKWFKSYDEAVEAGYVVKGGAELNPGKIEWVGGASGLMITVQ